MIKISSLGRTHLEPFEVKENTKKEDITAAPSTAFPGATLDQMIVQESLYRASVPNISQMERSEKIKKALESDLTLSEKFYLHKELFEIYFQNYKSTGANIDELCITIRAALKLSEPDRETYLKYIPPQIFDLVSTYLKLIKTADALATEAMLHGDIYSFPIPNAKVIEPYKPYLLEILQLEESLGCDIQGTKLVHDQIDTILTMANYLSTFMSNYLPNKPLAFYWDILVPIYHLCLTMLGQKDDVILIRMKEGNKNEALFSFVFSDLICDVFPARSKDDPVSKFYSLVMRYGHIDFMKTRFYREKWRLQEWEKDFQWIQFLKDGAEYIASTDPKTSQEYLDLIAVIEKGFIDKYIKDSGAVYRMEGNPFDLFLPYIIKHEELGQIKVYFNNFYKKSTEWDKAFEWICLYVKGARLLKKTDPEKSQAFLAKAKQLTKDTLAPSFFNWDHSSWKEREIEAFRLIREIEES